jgi:hypothetical protein
MSQSETIEELKTILATKQEATMTTTGQVLITPSSINKMLARNIAKELPLVPVFKDLGAVVARVLGDELLARGMRPADYADLDEMPEMLAQMVAQELSRIPEEFISSLMIHLKMKG